MRCSSVERRAVAEEIGFVVEQRLDDHLRQARLLTHDQDGDELVERGDPALAQQRRKRGLDPPAPAHGQLLSGPRFEQAGEDSARAVAYLHARLLLGPRGDPPGDLVGRQHRAGEPGLEHRARHSPDGAAGLVLGDDRTAAGDQPRCAFDAVAAHAGQDDAQRAGAIDRPDRGEHRVDRGHAAAAAPAVGQSNDGAGGVGFERQMRVARSNEDAVGQQLHAVFRDHGFAARDRAELAREHAS